MDGYEIREYRPGDEPALLATFNEVFAKGHPDVEPRTLDHWRWAFRHNPAGSRIWLALADGQVAAQYAALPYRVWIDGRESTFAQVVDSMVHPEHRRGLKRPGLFVETARPFFEAYGGPDKDLVHYGWPVEKAWRIGRGLLGYEMVRTQNLLARQPGEGPTELPDGVERLTAFDHQARWLWDRCSGDWGASTIRDDRFLNWRFVEAPHAYVLLGARDAAGVLRGYAVYRHCRWLVPNMGVLVDWLVPPAEPEVGERLVEAGLAQARADGADSLTLILPEWSPWFVRLQRLGFLVWESDYFLVARHFARRYDSLWLRDHWWYQLADTDLV